MDLFSKAHGVVSDGQQTPDKKNYKNFLKQ